MSAVGRGGAPLRVAIVGSGPAGFYTAEHLQRHPEISVEIDMYERLPTPYGLVRGGVAPDHQKIKSVTKAYERIAARPGFRFYGCVEMGRDITVEELEGHYHVVVLAVGAPTDRRMGIPGEDLAGSVSATDFVAWYNAHPDYAALQVDLSASDAVVVGNGNVAVDVARILVTPVDILAATDIADHALTCLRESNITTVTMLGRRGPAQAAFTSKEIRELGEIPGVTLVVDPADLVLDTASQSHVDEDAHRIIGALQDVAGRTPGEGDRVIRLKFLTSPIEIRGATRAEEVVVARNELVAEGGALRAKATDDAAVIPAGLVLRAVGYRAEAVPGFPFDDRAGVIPNDVGRVRDCVGRYVAGWIKRGPQGVIGTNKADAGETVKTLLSDVAEGAVCAPEDTDPASIDHLVRTRVPHVVTWDDWLIIDDAERTAGAAAGRPRTKFATVDDMLGVLKR
jgi:ferredoxin--NADP+ reductase